jgi:hypothetical protein
MDAKRSIHRKTSGFAICIHTCVPGGCKNKAGQILWNREGSPLRKHAANRGKHQQCGEACPGYNSLGKTHGTFPFTRVTDMEVDDDVNMDVDAPHPSGSVHPQPSIQQAPIPPYLRESSLVSVDSQTTIDLNYNVESTTPWARAITTKGDHRTFKILYVPDPTRTCTVSRAESDLAFLKTAISEREYNILKHLEGSIHLVSCRQTGHENTRYVVHMQEWVSFIIG